MGPCKSISVQYLEHNLVWHSTLDGGGYFACHNLGCDYVESDTTGHNGG